jgi:hypothetical protein
MKILKENTYVYLHSSGGYTVRLPLKGKYTYMGLFSTIEEARIKRDLYINTIKTENITTTLRRPKDFMELLLSFKEEEK